MGYIILCIFQLWYLIYSYNLLRKNPTEGNERDSMVQSRFQASLSFRTIMKCRISLGIDRLIITAIFFFVASSTQHSTICTRRVSDFVTMLIYKLIKQCNETRLSCIINHMIYSRVRTNCMRWAFFTITFDVLNLHISILFVAHSNIHLDKMKPCKIIKLQNK